MQLTPTWENLGRGIMHFIKSNIRVFNSYNYNKIKSQMEKNLNFFLGLA